MKFQSKFFRMSLLSAALLLLSFTSASAQDSEFSFTVYNKTKSTIKKLLVSENGKKYGYFDIGSGIAPGKKVELVWSKSTDTEKCVQWVKAVYADQSESEPVKFDFCEEDLELEFTD
jgi:hypothetical protein